MLLKNLRGSGVGENTIKETSPNKENQDKFQSVVEGLPLNVMLCNPETLDIIYANSTSIETLRPLEKYLPIKADELIGSCIDIFHKNPSHQRALLADPSNLPHNARIKVAQKHLIFLSIQFLMIMGLIFLQHLAGLS